MVKKSNGEGSINRYKNGWRSTITIGRDSNGKLIRKQFYGKTKIEALEKMNEYKDNNRRGLIVNDEKMTFRQWYKIWLFEFKINELKSATIARYDVIYRNHIKDNIIGNMKLKDINTITLQSYYNDLIKEGKSEKFLKYLHKAIKPAVKYAKKLHYINYDFTEDITLPKIKNNKSDSKAFSKEEQKKFLNVIENHKYRMQFILALGTGLRIGELTALKWKDIDFEKGTLNIVRAVSGAYIPKRLGLKENPDKITTPKTESSVRIVTIPNSILKELKKYKEKQDIQKEKFKEIYNDKDYVFANDIGEYILPDTLRKSFVKVLEDNNLRHISFHGLRHSYATRLFEKGVSLKIIQKLLGHSSLEITADIYTHIINGEKISAVQKLNDLFKL
ncbi:tyrosine-type recombinase/integrase [Clostridium butyricum]